MNDALRTLIAIIGSWLALAVVGMLISFVVIGIIRAYEYPFPVLHIFIRICLWIFASVITFPLVAIAVFPLWYFPAILNTGTGGYITVGLLLFALTLVLNFSEIFQKRKSLPDNNP